MSRWNTRYRSSPWGSSLSEEILKLPCKAATKAGDKNPRVMGPGTVLACKHADRFGSRRRVAREGLFSPFFTASFFFITIRVSSYLPRPYLYPFCPFSSCFFSSPRAIPMHICALLYEEYLSSPVVVAIFRDIRREYAGGGRDTLLSPPSRS